MTMKMRGLIVFTASLLAGSSTLLFSPESAAAEGCTITCEYCYIDRNTQTARCEQCTFRCTTPLQ